MTAVSADARISPGCAGVYAPDHAPAWKRITDFVHGHSLAKIGLQLGHAGRKGATRRMWEGPDDPLPDGAWPLLAASALPYLPKSQVPKAMDATDMERVAADHVRAAQLADEAGFDLLELHCAHGYLLASFLSPLTNRRTDAFGGDVQGRLAYPLTVFDAVRKVWPKTKPMSVRISACDWAPGGLSNADATSIARAFYEHGADIIDVSAGQTVPDQKPVYGRLFQTPLSELIRLETGIPTMTVGNIQSYADANSIIAAQRADLCVLARAHLYDPYWTKHAANALGYQAPWPPQYQAVQKYNLRFS
jgi:anthraniloyl-CoA monooxygenase